MLIYNRNQVNVPYRHKHEIFSEKVIIFHEFSLIFKMSASNLVPYVNIYIVFRGQRVYWPSPFSYRTENEALAAILKGWQNSPGYFEVLKQAQYLNFIN